MFDYMLKALELAGRAVGSSSPNPAVGAVLVRDGQIVGAGYTQPPGGPHAEIVALRQAGDAARGATLYVTLEPCSHVGRTGPCAEALLAAGVAEVHVATLDPSPWVNGSGLRALQEAGVRVVLGERAREAERLNEAYFHWVRTGRPFVTAKWAMTLDGKVATHTGSSRWVSGTRARALVGSWRRQADAVLVGVGTVLRDDPLLTARAADGALLDRQPRRVVLDSRLRLPPTARLLQAEGGPVLVLTTEHGPAEAAARLEAAGATVIRVPARRERVDLCAALQELGRHAVTSVLVEAGPTLLGALFEDGLVDKVAAFIAPKIAGGTAAPTPVGGAGVAEMAQALALADLSCERVGDDLLVVGYLPTAAAVASRA